MNVTVRGILRFKHKPALERGIAAFEGRAYPEFFTSAIWKVEGLVASCELTFEIEVDCHYEDAFLAMALEAVDGAVDLRASDLGPKFTRVMKFGRPLNRWAKMELDDRYAPVKFGVSVARFPAEWAAASEAKGAKAAKAAKEPGATAKSAKKPRATAKSVKKPAS